jgi:hypothetical protein
VRKLDDGEVDVAEGDEVEIWTDQRGELRLERLDKGKNGWGWSGPDYAAVDVLGIRVVGRGGSCVVF